MAWLFSAMEILVLTSFASLGFIALCVKIVRKWVVVFLDKLPKLYFRVRAFLVIWSYSSGATSVGFCDLNSTILNILVGIIFFAIFYSLTSDQNSSNLWWSFSEMERVKLISSCVFSCSKCFAAVTLSVFVDWHYFHWSAASLLELHLQAFLRINTIIVCLSNLAQIYPQNQ